MSAKNDERRNWQGGKWITPLRRLAIYLRDGMACSWCGAGVEDGARLSLDHLTPNVHGGTNESTNLVTACSRCNSSRGSRSVEEFAWAVAAYLNHGVKAEDITAHVLACAQRSVPTAEAKELLARRGGIAAAVADRNGGL